MTGNGKQRTTGATAALGAWFPLAFVGLLLGLALASACTRSAGDGDAERSTPRVVATTTMLEDLVRTIGGSDVEVHGLLRAGVDPHLYQPVPSDVRRVAGSGLVVMNGLHLEGWIERLVANAGGQRAVVAVGEGIEALADPDAPGGVDPHIWFDVMLWERAAGVVEAALVELLAGNAEGAARVRARASAYRETLRALDAWVRAQVETVPQAQRVLVTSHDAFGYFGRAYGLEVEAIQGISTDQEASQRDVVRVIELVRSRGVPSVFAETSVDSGLIAQVARETGASMRGPLHSDSLGPPGSAAATYVGMVVENVGVIVRGLGGQVAPFPGMAGEGG